MRGRSKGLRTQGHRVLIVAVVLTVMAAIGAGGAFAAGLIGGRKPDFRVAEVIRGEVSEQVELTGSVTRVNQAAATFPTAGRVTWVGVEVGSKVSRGQRLARIDRLPLQVALVQAQAELTQARVTYRKDLKAAEDAAKRKKKPAETPPPDGSGSGGGSAPGGPPPGGPPPAKPAPPSPTMVKLNQLLAKLPAQLAAAEAACGPLVHAIPPSAPTLATPTLGPAPSQSESASTTPSASPGPSTSSPSASPRPTTARPTRTPSNSPSPTQASADPWSPGAVALCQSRLTEVSANELAAVGLLNQAMAELTQATAQLAALAEANAQAAANGSAAPPPGSTGSDSEAEMLAVAATGEGTSSESAGALRVQLAQDLVALTKAQQAVDKAKRDLAGATMKAPISGVVGQIDFAIGEQATTADQLIIVGKGSSRVSVRVPLALMGKVSAAQAAAVIPPGMSKSIQGKVTLISPIPAANSAGSPSYPTVISVARSPVALTTGVSATVRIEVARASNALIVPMSATVPINERQATVRVLSPAGTADEVTVKTGVRGISRIEITSGLQAGDKVVLADPNQPLPSINIFTGEEESGSESTSSGGSESGAGESGGGAEPAAEPTR